MGFTRVRVINRNKLVQDFCSTGQGQKVGMLKKKKKTDLCGLPWISWIFCLPSFHSSVQSYRQSRCSHTWPIRVSHWFVEWKHSLSSVGTPRVCPGTPGRGQTDTSQARPMPGSWWAPGQWTCRRPSVLLWHLRIITQTSAGMQAHYWAACTCCLYFIISFWLACWNSKN